MIESIRVHPLTMIDFTILGNSGPSELDEAINALGPEERSGPGGH